MIKAIDRPQRRRKEVLQWLRDNGLYDKIKRRIPFPMDRYPTDENHLDDYFHTLFNWKYSPEGYQYWKEINDKYLRWYYNTDTK